MTSTAVLADEPAEDRALARQHERLADAPALYRQMHERLALELALHVEDAEAIFAEHHYTPEQAAELLESPAFSNLLARTVEQVRTEGLSFRHKARAIAEDLLPHMYEIATDPYASAAVRADIAKWTAKVAGLEPKDKDEGKGVGGGLTLSITFAGQPPVRVIDGVQTAEQITYEESKP